MCFSSLSLGRRLVSDGRVSYKAAIATFLGYVCCVLPFCEGGSRSSCRADSGRVGCPCSSLDKRRSEEGSSSLKVRGFGHVDDCEGVSPCSEEDLTVSDS